MTKIKNSLLREIDLKIKRKKEKSLTTLDPKDYRSAVFDFFKNTEECRLDPGMMNLARISLIERLSIIDSRCKVNVHCDENLRGVTIIWSPSFARQNNIESQVYIDVGEMLLI
jgi:hypothetical protein